MENDTPKHRCRECGCDKFISSPNSYDVFIARGDTLYYQRSEVDDMLELFCSDCGEEIADPNPKLL